MQTLFTRSLSDSLVLTLLIALATTGCRSLPETGVKSFASATTMVAVSVTAAGNRAVQDVADVHDNSAASKQQAELLSKDLKQEWAKRIKVMEGLSRYAASLSALIESGKAGKENARAFVDSLSGLANAVGVAVPAAPAVTAILNLAERSYEEIAKHLAANQIYKAVEKADPIVNGLSGLISEDLLNLRSIAVERRRTVLNQLRTTSDLPAEFNSFKQARSKLAIKALADPPDPVAIDTLAKLNEASAHLASDPEYLAFHDRELEVDRLFDLQKELLDQASATIFAWGVAHHELLLGLEQKKTPSLAELQGLATDLYDIYKSYRTARSKS